MEVANADLKGTDASLTLEVTAVAPTLGWTDVGLSPVIYVVPPQDGVQEFTLTGTPPSGPSAEQLEVFELTTELTPPAWLLGVRVTPVARKGSSAGLTLHRARLQAPQVGQDMLFVGALGARGDKLVVPVSYSGGCAKHSFQLSWDGNVQKSNPPQVVLELSHDAHGDACRMLVEETLQFDLSVLGGLPAEEQRLVVSVNGVAVQTILYTPPSAKGLMAARPRCPDCYLDLRDWHAFHDTMPGGPHSLYVIGNVVVPAQGYAVGLTPANPQGLNPRILLLDLVVQRPQGNAATVITTEPARWNHPGAYDGRFSDVHIRCGSQVVLKLPIQVVS